MKIFGIVVASNIFFIVSIATISVLLIALIIVCALLIAKNKRSNKVDDVKIIDGVRCTKNEDISTQAGNMRVSINPKDIILSMGVTLIAKKDSNLLPGKYTVLSSCEDTTKFNIRKGNFVREFSHGDDIVLADNEEICAVSHTVILR